MDLNSTTLSEGFYRATIEPATIRHSQPADIRLAVDPDGREFIQVAHLHEKGSDRWIEWEEIKRVKVDHDGKEIE